MALAVSCRMNHLASGPQRSLPNHRLFCLASSQFLQITLVRSCCPSTESVTTTIVLLEGQSQQELEPFDGQFRLISCLIFPQPSFPLLNLFGHTQHTRGIIRLRCAVPIWYVAHDQINLIY